MAVHFMFAASKQYESVSVVGDSISLAELKDEIAMLKFRGTLEGRRIKEPFDFRVYDAETKEEIVGAHTRVRRNSCVVVKRVPAFVVSQQQVSQQVVAHSSGVQGISERREPQDVVDDGFGEDVYSASSVSGVSSNKNSSGNSTTSSMTAIESSEEVKKAEVVSANRIVRPKAVEARKVVKAVKKNVSLERVVNSSLGSRKLVPCKVEVPLELTCSLCHDIMKDPVLIPCCCNSFCRNCVKLAFAEQQKCPKCESSKCRDSDLLPNRHVKTMVDCFLKNNASASNSVSSNGSCSSQSIVSSISSEHGQKILTPRKKTSDAKPSLASNISNSSTGMAKCSIISCSQVMAPGSINVCGKRKPLTISLMGAKKAR